MLTVGEYIALWKRVNDYAEACGGHTNGPIDNQRLAAIEELNRMFYDLLSERQAERESSQEKLKHEQES